MRNSYFQAILFSVCFLILAVLERGGLVQAQNAIGKNSISPGALLDFGAQQMTMILPRVLDISQVALPQDGMLLWDLTNACLKGYQNGSWNTCGSTVPSAVTATGNLNHTSTIGSANLEESALLKLESSEKALILPHVAFPESTILTQTPGMIFYNVSSGCVAVSDGTNFKCLTTE